MDTSTFPIEYMLICFIAFVIWVFVMRWVFGIDTMLKSFKSMDDEAKKQTRLLSEIAEKQGVLKDVIVEIRK